MSEPAVALVERARAHLAAAAAPLTPHAVAEALRGAGPVGHDTVLAVHARLVRDVEGAGPLQGLLATPGVTDVLLDRVAAAGDRRLRIVDQPLEAVGHQRDQQLLLGAHVVVERRRGDAGTLRELADAGAVEATLGEELERGPAHAHGGGGHGPMLSIDRSTAPWTAGPTRWEPP